MEKQKVWKEVPNKDVPKNAKIVNSTRACVIHPNFVTSITCKTDTNLAAPEGGRREEDIAATIATEGLEDMAQNLLPRERRWFRDRRTWGMLRKGREVRSRTDYILGTDRRLFGNVSVRDPQHNSDHYMVLGCLPSASLTEHKRYLGGRKRWPVRLPSKPTRVDQLFTALRRAVPKAGPREARRNA